MSKYEEEERERWSKAVAEGRARRVEVKPRAIEGSVLPTIEQLHALEKQEAKRIRRLFRGFSVRIEVDPDIGQKYVYIMEDDRGRKADIERDSGTTVRGAPQIDDRLISVASQIAASDKAMIGVETGEVANHEAFEDVRALAAGVAFDAATRQAHMPPMELTVGGETVSVGGHRRAYRPVEGDEQYDLLVQVTELSRRARPNGRATVKILENRSKSLKFYFKVGEEIEVRLRTSNDARSIELLADGLGTMEGLPVKVSDHISTRSLKIVYHLRAIG